MKTPSNQSHALRGEQLIALSRSGQNRQFWELPKVGGCLEFARPERLLETAQWLFQSCGLRG
jgi:hypothetical protein